MKKRININKQYLNFIKVKAFVTDEDGYFYMRKKGRGRYFDTVEIIVNVDFITKIDIPRKDEVYIKNYTDSSFSTSQLYFFRIQLSTEEYIYIDGNDFTKFKFLDNK